VHANRTNNTLARKGVLIIEMSTFLLFVRGDGLDGSRLRRSAPIATIPQLFCFGGDLREVQHQILLAAIARNGDARIGRRSSVPKISCARSLS
jgi:hypothetical protein